MWATSGVEYIICLLVWINGQNMKLERKEKSFWITWIISVYVHSKVQHVFVFLHQSDIKPLDFTGGKESESYGGCQSAALREGRAFCGLYSGSIAPCRCRKRSTGSGGLVVSKSLTVEAPPSQLKGIHNGPPPWRGSCRRWSVPLG